MPLAPQAPRTVAFRIAYHGARFHGMQVQPGDRTVQGEIEAALRSLWGDLVRIRFAGRTDAGVHATAQVIAFEVPNRIPLAALRQVLNGKLGGEIRLLEAWEAKPGFHPRFAAVRREYTYLLDAPGMAPDPFRSGLVTFAGGDLDWSLVIPHCGDLLGEHDFTAYCSKPAAEERPVRSLEALEIHTSGALVRIRLVGRSFLRGMVRHIVGAFLRIASGEKPGDYLCELLELGLRQAKDDTLKPAPPDGLYLTGVDFPEGLPGTAVLPVEIGSAVHWWRISDA